MKNFLIKSIILIFSLFLNYQFVFAATMNLENSSNNKSDQVKIDEPKDQVKSKNSAEDLFGDEQTFPFVAGLGKNAAH